jgi:hypothetical protein
MLVSYSGGVYIFSGFGDSATAVLDTNYSPVRFSWNVELVGGCPRVTRTTRSPFAA